MSPPCISLNVTIRLKVTTETKKTKKGNFTYLQQSSTCNWLLLHDVTVTQSIYLLKHQVIATVATHCYLVTMTDNSLTFDVNGLKWRVPKPFPGCRNTSEVVLFCRASTESITCRVFAGIATWAFKETSDLTRWWGWRRTQWESDCVVSGGKQSITSCTLRVGLLASVSQDGQA